jgi:hypothetical protein
MPPSHQRKKNAFVALMGAAKQAKKVVTHKKRAKTMKSFFPSKKNHQGFPMKECKFQKAEGAHMYRPWWYGRSYTNDPDNEGVYPTYCKHCKLQPCITVENKHTMPSLGKRAMEEDKRTPAQARLAVANRLEMARRRIFQLDFGDPPSHTPCMTDFVNLWFPDKERGDFWLPLKVAKQPLEVLTETTEQNTTLTPWVSEGVAKVEQVPQFDYGDSDCESEGNIPLELLRDHTCGDVSLKEKVHCYRMVKAKQSAADAINQYRTAKEMLDLEGAASEEEFEF